MFETPEALISAIQRGEDSYLELKEAVFAGSKVKGPRRDALADEVAAFANARGGVIVLGVSDQREIVGIPQSRMDAAERYVSDLVHDLVRPPPFVTIVRSELPDESGLPRLVIRIDIPRSLFVHESLSGYYHRIGGSKRRMDSDYLARLFQQRSHSRLVRFDELPVENAALPDLDPRLVERFRGDLSRDEMKVLARKLGMAVPKGSGDYCPTVAGVLLGTREPERWLRHAYVQAVAYRGRKVSDFVGSSWYQLDAKDITGPLDEQIAGACKFVFRNQGIQARKSAGRVDLPEYDMISVFEAVVNAVVHRDYSMSGSRIRMKMFSDRLELYSPGGLPNTMSVDELPYRVATRNETLAGLLSRSRIPDGIEDLEEHRRTLMERRGDGVRLLLRRSKQHSGRQPEYRLIGGSELLLTIFAARRP